jgi:hypothetical protein
VRIRRKLFASFVASVTIGAAAACSGSSSGGPADSGAEASDVVDAGHEGNPFAYDTGATPDTGMVCSSHRPPKLAADTATLSLTGVEFGDTFPDGSPYFNAWKDIGYNLDDLCTKAGDTDVCIPPDNGSRDAEADGDQGVDNAFGANVLPLVKEIQANIFSTAAVTLDINGGTGFLFLGSNGGNELAIPLTHAVAAISTNGGGTLAGIIPAAALKEQIRAFAGRQTTSACTSAGTQSILMAVGQSADILADGTQSATATCAGITIGVGFSGSQAGSSPVPPVDPCDQ